MSRGLACMCVIATVLVHVSSARAATCGDSNGTWTCCEHWVVDETGSGEHHVAISEDTYDEAVRASEQRRLESRMLCKYWGTASDCDAVLSAPRCAGSGPLPADPCVAVEPWLKGTLDEEAAAAEHHFAIESDSLAAIRTGARLARPPTNGSLGLRAGDAMVTFGRTHADAIRRARDLRTKLTEHGAWNPYMDCIDKALDSPRDLFFGRGVFGGHVEAAADAGTNLEIVDTATRYVKKAPAMAAVATTRGPGTFKVVAQSGSGRLIFGAQGPATEGGHLAPGEIPTAFVTFDADGNPELHPVKQEVVAAGVLRISGEADGSHEIVGVTQVAESPRPVSTKITSPAAPAKHACPDYQWEYAPGDDYVNFCFMCVDWCQGDKDPILKHYDQCHLTLQGKSQACCAEVRSDYGDLSTHQLGTPCSR